MVRCVGVWVFLGDRFYHVLDNSTIEPLPPSLELPENKKHHRADQINNPPGNTDGLGEMVGQ